jgi:hypothetical protein
MGYRGPLVPTTLLENGMITTDDYGGFLFGGERFTAAVMIGPEFFKPRRRGRFRRRLLAQCVNEESLTKLGVPKLAIEEGALFTDGSVVLTDTDSLLAQTPKAFTITADGHSYTGTSEGLVALKASSDGSVEKFAGAAVDELRCDGKSLHRPGVRGRKRYSSAPVGKARTLRTESCRHSPMRPLERIFLSSEILKSNKLLGVILSLRKNDGCRYGEKSSHSGQSAQQR